MVTQLQNVYRCLDFLNVDPAHLDRRDEEDIKAYRDAVMSENPVVHSKYIKAVDQINAMECEGFIPSKLAIFLKNNLKDPIFTASLLTKLIGHFKEIKKISPKLSSHLLSLIDNSRYMDAIQFLYACMLNPQRTNLSALDELRSYSDNELVRFIQHQEQLASRRYIKDKLNKLSQSLPPDKVERYITPLLVAIEADNGKKFKAELIVFLRFMIKAEPNHVKRYCYEDMLDSFISLPESGFFKTLHHALRTQDFYGKYVSHVRDVTAMLQAVDLASLPEQELFRLVDKCKKAYQNTIAVLADIKNMSCASKTAFCLVYGQLSTEWLKINKFFNAHKHLLCRCHASGHAQAVWPLYKKKEADLFFSHPDNHESQDNAEFAAVIGCDWGAGHRIAAENTGKILDRVGMHPISVNLPKEVLSEEDPVTKAIGWLIPGFNISRLVNALAKHGAFRVYNFLRGHRKPEQPSPLSVKKVVQHLLKINPSIVVSTYQRHNEIITAAAKIIGRPILNISTDVDVSVDTRDKPPSHPHFKLAVSIPEKNQMDGIVGKVVTQEQVVVSGPPVREVYDRKHTPQEIERFKEDWDIPKDKKLLLVTSGSNGGNSHFPEFLVRRYAGKKAEEIPYYLVVLCGKDNAKFRNYLTNKVAPKTNLGIEAHTIVSPQEMEQLLAMASFGGQVLGKPGGMTLFEEVKRGNRMIIDEIPSSLLSAGIGHFFLILFDRFLSLFGISNKLPWEKVNHQYAVDQGLAQVVHNEKEFNKALDKGEGKTEPVELPIPNFQERLPQIVDEMRQKVATDSLACANHISNIDATQVLI